MSNVLSPRIIRASAGTGKTRELSSRYIGLLALGESPDRILATTFTRKAAAEIRERVFSRLARAAQDSDAASELGSCFGNASFTSADALTLLGRLARDQHRLLITTLDSLFISIAKSFALELGLPADWRIASNRDLSLLREEAVRKLFEEDKRAIAIELVRSFQGGTFARSVHQQIVDDVRLLYETYLFSSEEAWNWIEAPVLPSAEERSLMLERLKSFPVPLKKAEKGKEPQPDARWQKALSALHSVVERRNWLEFVDKGLGKNVISGELSFYSRPIEEPLVKIIQWFIEEARTSVRARLRVRLRALCQMLSVYHLTYSDTQRQLGTLGFDDVKRHLARSSILGSIDQIYYRLDSRIKHLLLDEFQDTSMNEWRIVRPFAAEILSQQEDHSFFCVGDVKQAIYGWRGGVSEIFNTIEKNWPHVQLETNQTTYRCAPAIVEFVNTVFEALPNAGCLAKHHAAVSEWLSRFETHKSARSELQGCVSVEVLPEDGKSTIDRAVELAVEMHARYPDASIGILVRENKTISALLSAFTLSGYDIDVSEEGGNALIDSQAVRLLLSALRYVEHPSDLIAFTHLAECGVVELLGIPRPEERGAPWREGIRAALIRSGYGVVISAWVQKIRGRCGNRERIRLEQLVDLAHRFDGSGSQDIDDFYAFVSEEKVELPSEAPVRVMNFHQSKGLEFDIVILPEFSTTLRPDAKILLDRETPVDEIRRVVPTTNSNERKLLTELEALYDKKIGRDVGESLSLLYVALTRARQGMTILLPEKSRNAQLSLARVLLEALPVSTGIQVLSGKEGWSHVSSGESHRQSSDQTIEVTPVSFRAEGKRGVVLPRVSPSSFHRQRVSEEFRAQSKEARVRGTILHAYFEQIEWFDTFALDEESLLRLARRQGGTKAQAMAALTEFKGFIENTRCVEHFSRTDKHDDNTRVYRELPFAVSRAGEMIVGSIDRLIVLFDGNRAVSAEVIDFKTDRVDSQWMSVHVDTYKPQLEMYCYAVQRLFGEHVQVKASILSLHLMEKYTLV